MTTEAVVRLQRVVAVRAELLTAGPKRTRPFEGDFERVTLPADDCDLLRDTLDAAFVDGSHRFHEVFVDLYFLRKLVRPGGLIILDDATLPSVSAAIRYFDLNLGWQPVPIEGRLTARRLPDQPFEPSFSDFKSF